MPKAGRLGLFDYAESAKFQAFAICGAPILDDHRHAPIAARQQSKVLMCSQDALRELPVCRSIPYNTQSSKIGKRRFTMWEHDLNHADV